MTLSLTDSLILFIFGPGGAITGGLAINETIGDHFRKFTQEKVPL